MQFYRQKPIFKLEDHDKNKNGLIKCVKTSGSLIVIGTVNGRVHVFDYQQNKLIETYQAHDTGIIGLWALADKAIITCS